MLFSLLVWWMIGIVGCQLSVSLRTCTIPEALTFEPARPLHKALRILWTDLSMYGYHVSEACLCIISTTTSM